MEHRFFRVPGEESLRRTFLSRKEGRAVLRLGDREIEASAEPLGEQRFLMRLEGRQIVVDWARRDRDLFLLVDGETFHFREEDASHAAADGDHGEESEPTLHSPLPGKVVKLLVRPGDCVRKGQPLLVVDSMKVEMELKAHRAGTVDKILVQEGLQLEMGQALAVIR
jgi:3-methylcrotonyl-CoA carboxylase alpha subunit